MKKLSKILEGHTHKYDLSHSIKDLKEALEKISRIKEDLSSLDGMNTAELEEGWNLIDRYYGNITRSKNYVHDEEGVYAPNTSVKIFDK